MKAKGIPGIRYQIKGLPLENKPIKARKASGTGRIFLFSFIEYISVRILAENDMGHVNGLYAPIKLIPVSTGPETMVIFSG